MGKVWIDVTTTMYWSRPAVGIVRVEHELIKYALASNIDHCFFIYEQHDFKVVSEELVRSKVSNIYSETKEKDTLQSQVEVKARSGFFGLSIRRIRNSIYFLFLAFYQFLMAFLNDSAYNKINHRNYILYQNFKTSVKSSIRKKINIKNTSQPKREELRNVNKGNKYFFEDADTIISIGLTWDHGSEFVDLYEIRKKKSIKVITMCYDLIPIYLPHFTLSRENSINFEYNYDAMTWASDAVLCISKSSQLDYLRWINDKFMPEPVTKVVTLGSKIKQYDFNKLSKSVMEIDGKYLVFVSTIESRKNHYTIMKAIQYLIDNDSKHIPQVLFIGMRGWGVDDILNEYKLHPTLSKYIKLYHNLGDDDLSYLYQNCYFFLYPSYYEGWGLPVAEGLTYGKFGICSRTSSIPEVGGDLLEYIYPYDVVGWAKAIEFYMKNPLELKQKEDIIKQQFKENTWEKFGKQVFDVVRELEVEQ